MNEDSLFDNESPFTSPVGWPAESDWTEMLHMEFATESFRQLGEFVAQQRESETIYPPADQVYEAFRFSSFQQTKVVILGQDPYHGAGQAHGLSFSVAADEKIPPSLRNIYKELHGDLGCPIPEHGNLESWARQGVLLLNTVLTVQESKANSHRKKGWEKFTDAVIGLLGRRESPCVFILWGKPAEKKTALIGDQHTILVSPHPSPLSAHRGFFESRPFSKANDALQSFGQSPIDWTSISQD